MIHSFLLIGQSNMAGRGFLQEALPINTSQIYILRNGRWEAVFRPVNPDRENSGVNLAESFAQQYVKKYGVNVGLIPCADGGTALDQWQPGSLLFDHAVYQAKLAQRTSTIAGVLWHQGESDCFDHLYPTYQKRFETMMKAFRDVLDLHDVPFLVGGLGDFLQRRVENAHLLQYEKVNKQLETIAKDNPLTGFVSAKGLESNPDNLHFNAESLYEFGLRYFEEFEKNKDTNKVFEEKPGMDDIVRTEMELL